MLCEAFWMPNPIHHLSLPPPSISRHSLEGVDADPIRRPGQISSANICPLTDDTVPVRTNFERFDGHATGTS